MNTFKLKIFLRVKPRGATRVKKRIILSRRNMCTTQKRYANSGSITYQWKQTESPDPKSKA